MNDATAMRSSIDSPFAVMSIATRCHGARCRDARSRRPFVDTSESGVRMNARSRSISSRCNSVSVSR